MNLDRTSILILVVTVICAAAWAMYASAVRKRNADAQAKEPVWVEYARFIFAVGLIILMIRLFDLAAVLLALTVFTGAVWGGYWLYIKRKQPAAATPAAPKEPVLVEFSRFLFPVVLVVLVVRSFMVEPFQIPSESMLPTLEKGDFILVNRFAYGLRMPVFNVKLLEIGTPRRGDVIVFRNPQEPTIDYIKRVVGLPGDRIRYVNKRLYINDQPVSLIAEGVYSKQPDKKQFLEKLENVDHSILLMEYHNYHAFLPEGAEVKVPENHYFAMGDNRDNSKDSREWGFVPDANLKGRAFFIWFSWEEGQGPKWPRIGNSIN